MEAEIRTLLTAVVGLGPQNADELARKAEIGKLHKGHVDAMLGHVMRRAKSGDQKVSSNPL
jgi:hypothetical protein